MTATITELEEAEFKLVDAIWRLSLSEATADLRRRCQDMLDRVRARKASLLGDNPDVLRKSESGARRSPAEPRWFGLPCVESEVRELVKAARDRQSEERRLAKASGRDMPAEPDGALRQALRRPIVGNRGLIDFLTRRAGC